MSTNKRRQHAAEAFLNRMGAPKEESANEQDSAEAEEQSFGLNNEQNSVATNGQQSVITDEHNSRKTEGQEGNNAEEQNSNSTEKMRRITFHIPEKLFKQLKWLSVQEDMTMLEIGAAMAKEYIEKRSQDK